MFLGMFKEMYLVNPAFTIYKKVKQAKHIFFKISNLAGPLGTVRDFWEANVRL